jgi:hypothetical protein
LTDVPKTLEEAVQFLYENGTDNDRADFAAYGPASYHHSLGQRIRNEWGLWSGSDLKTHFETRFGLGHADDMSGMILEALEHKIKKIEFDADAKAKYYHEFWRSQGIDPLTQKHII